jgi:hypothetical protein
MWSKENAEDPAFMARHEAGPLIHIVYRENGAPAMGKKTFALGFIHYWVASIALACLMCRSRQALGSYWRRWKFVIWIGLFAAIFIDLSGPIWFHFPLSMPLVNLVYHISAGIVAGAVLAALVKEAPRSD